MSLPSIETRERADNGERFRSVTKSVCHSRIAARLTGVCRLDKEESIGEGERIEGELQCLPRRG